MAGGWQRDRTTGADWRRITNAAGCTAAEGGGAAARAHVPAVDAKRGGGREEAAEGWWEGKG